MKTTTNAEKHMDLIYAGEAARSAFAERFPEAEIKDASDQVHDERFEFWYSSDKREYLKWVLREGWGAVSFYVQMAIRVPGGQQDEIKDILDELKAEKPCRT